MENTREITDIGEYRMRRKRAGSARWILILVFLVACLFAGYFFARSGFFAVRQITVEGNRQIAEERLVELSGFTLGANLFSVTVADSEQWLLIEPRIKTAEVRRIWPGTVKISVTERQPRGLIGVGSSILQIDDEGRVLSRYALVEDQTLPLVSGLDMEGQGSVPGSLIDAEGIEAALTVLTSLPEDAEGIGEINVANPQGIQLYTVSGVQIQLGDCSSFPEKYLVYSNILSDHQNHSNKLIEYIDVSIPGDPAIKYK